jgi:hypothetical protein
MWSSSNEQTADARILKYAIERQGSPASLADVLRGWRDDAGFRTFFTGLLASAPYSAFRWETPPATLAKLDRRFEFVLLDSPGLAPIPDPDPFAMHFQSAVARETVLEFPNLGNDAILVVPRPIGPETDYGHLAAFLRGAPALQITPFGNRSQAPWRNESERGPFG